MSTCRVLVQPSGLAVELSRDEPLMAAAERQDLIWPTVCGGEGTCLTCAVRVVEGSENAAAASAWERENLANLPASLLAQGNVRLACQLRFTGNAVVHKPGVRPAKAAARS